MSVAEGITEMEILNVVLSYDPAAVVEYAAAVCNAAGLRERRTGSA